jgi:hypothetical protein
MVRQAADGLVAWQNPVEVAGVVSMPYIARDANGKITGVYQQADVAGAEILPDDHPEVREYLAQRQRIELVRQSLETSDVETVRVIEDLIDVLIEKNLLLLTDLPFPAQEKLLQRQRMRQTLGAYGGLMVSEEDIL